MNFFIAVVFVLANGVPQMVMSELFYPTEQHCLGALHVAGERLAALPHVEVAYGRCFEVNAKSV